eukprot:4313256-Pleurochrysis_carterae.AAC.1
MRAARERLAAMRSRDSNLREGRHEAVSQAIAFRQTVRCRVKGMARCPGGRFPPQTPRTGQGASQHEPCE